MIHIIQGMCLATFLIYSGYVIWQAITDGKGDE